MISILMDDLPHNVGGERAVVPVSGRCTWQIGRVLGGTVNSVAAATDGISPGAIWTAEIATLGAKVIVVPPASTYMEIGAWGDTASISQAAQLEFWRTHGLPIGTQANKSAYPGSPDVWKRLRNLNGADPFTFDTATVDTTGTAGASRYVINEAAINDHLYDVRGARIIVAKLLQTLTGGNWSLWFRFF